MAKRPQKPHVPPARAKKPLAKSLSTPVIGRPTKLTPQVQQKIVFAIANGNAEETAAEYAGIGATTFFRWMRQGAEARKGSPLWQFRQAVKEAQVNAEMSHVITIEQARSAHWQANAWWLERRRNDRWGKKENIEITIRREAERLARETGLDVEEIIAEAERLTKA